MASFSTSYSVPAMTTSGAQSSRALPSPGIFFIVTTTTIYVVSRWIEYELEFTPNSALQPTPIRMIEWGPVLVVQIFVWAAILGTLALLVQSSRRLFRRPSECSSLGRLGRLIESTCSGVVASGIYFLGVLIVFKLWNLNFWILQTGIVAGSQYPLFRLWRFQRERTIHAKE